MYVGWGTIFWPTWRRGLSMDAGYTLVGAGAHSWAVDALMIWPFIHGERLIGWSERQGIADTKNPTCQGREASYI
jgi:hypothetical protein